MYQALGATILVAGLAAATPLQAAVAAPEILFEFPGNSSANNRNLELKVGRALDGGGEVVASAYFTLYSSETQSSALWVTDGTLTGTHLAAPNRIWGNQAIAADVGLFFTAYDSTDALQVFRTQGSSSSVLTLTQEAVLASSLKGVIGSDVVLARPGPSGQTATWRLNGTSGAPTLMGLLPGSGQEWANANQHVVAISYSAGIGYGVTSLPGDGSQPFTISVPAPNTYWDYPHRMGAGPRIACLKAFTHYSTTEIRQELYCTDGTSQGTRIPVPASGGPGVPLMDGVTFYPLGDRLMIDGVLGSVWITDGSDAGTLALIDGYTQRWYSCSDGRVGSMHFIAARAEEAELWVSDGTRDGTQRVLTLAANNNFCPKKGTAVPGSNLVYLQIGPGPDGGTYLFHSDGTANGFGLVEGSPSLLSLGSTQESVQGIVALGRWLVFAAPVSATHDGLWRLDLDPIFSDGLED